MTVTVSNVLTIEDWSPDVLLWCRKNLTLANPDYAKKARMHLWLGSTPRTLALYEQRGRALVLPFGVLRRLGEFAPAGTEYRTRFPAPVPVSYGGAGVPLYDYQRRAVESAFASRYGILSSPAGSGKTQMGIALVKRYGRRALWLTHTLDLLRQSMARAELYMDKRLIGTITEGKVNIGAGITFATVQTMSRLDLTTYRDVWDVVIVDECHRCAGTPTAVTQFYKVLNALAARHKYGLSATVHRADGMIAATHALLGEVVYTVLQEDVADRIMQVGVKPVTTGVVETRECLNTDGTKDYMRLMYYLATNAGRNALIRDCIVREREHSCLILSNRLEQLELLLAALPGPMRKNAAMITGGMVTKKAKREREQALADMREGKKRYLFATYALAKEGLDIPRLDRLFMASPVSDYAVVTQSIGRIDRACEGKAPPVVYDFVDDIGYLVRCYRTRLSHYKKAGCYLCD